MRRSENIILLACLCCTLASCKTVPSDPVVIYTQEAIETSAVQLSDTSGELLQIVQQVETAGSVTKEQIQALSSKTTALVSQTETLVKIVQTQTENIKTMQAQKTDEINRLKQENEKALLVQYDLLSEVKSELSAVTAERDRAISKLKPWKNTAIVLIIVFILLLALTIIKLMIKYMV
jgi:sorbitol-specific phosphotransferase system component IIBC